MYLTEGAIQSILNNENIDQPILKISNMKRILTPNSIDKIRLILTDGILNHKFVMLCTQLNPRVDSGEIAQDSIIRLNNYVIKEQNQRSILMITDLTVLHANDLENLPPPVKKLPTELAKPQILNTVKSTLNVVTIPITLLNPYQNKWIIKGRIIAKDRIRTWSKPSGDGKLFSFTMIDDSCDIRVTAFNQEVDKFYDLIEVDKTYILSRGVVKVANRQFNNTKCDHEITLKSESEITEVTGDDIIPALKYEFISIDSIRECSPNSNIDVIGVAHEIRDVSTIIAKATNKELTKRDVILVDRSGCSINLTLWNDDTKLVDNLEHPVMVIRSAIVKDFGGRSLSAGNGTILKVNPIDVPDAGLLIGWYQGLGHETRFEAQSGSGGFKQTKKVMISQLTCAEGDKGEYYNVTAVFATIKKENMVYKACKKCNKKVFDLNNSLYKCERCNQETPDFMYRLMVNLNIIDHSGSTWVTAFQETAEKILGVSANTIGQYYEEERTDEIEKIINGLVYAEDFHLKLRVNNDTYNDETRMKVSLQDATVANITDEITELNEELKI